MEAFDLNISLDLDLHIILPPDIHLGGTEVRMMSKPAKEGSSAKVASACDYPVLKVDEIKIPIVSTVTEGNRSVWPAEDYYEGDDVYDELYPRN